MVRGCYLGDTNSMTVNKPYLCSKDRCNGIQADSKLIGKILITFNLNKSIYFRNENQKT